ncbi:MAG: 50S ribosomal protein L17 [Deltaproteobacteria bacterium]|nr:50S ribosomal protein L17 [Deltaproteobacteria bacterium]
MRHQVSGRKLNRTASHRKAMFRNMATSLLVHEKIRTTVPKAKELRRKVEKLITLGKRGDLHARRIVMKGIKDMDAVSKLFGELKERYARRPGGYTRIVRIGQRSGDAAPMAQIELMPAGKKKKRKKKSSSKKVGKAENNPDE